MVKTSENVCYFNNFPLTAILFFYRVFNHNVFLFTFAFIRVEKRVDDGGFQRVNEFTAMSIQRGSRRLLGCPHLPLSLSLSLSLSLFISVSISYTFYLAPFIPIILSIIFVIYFCLSISKNVLSPTIRLPLSLSLSLSLSLLLSNYPSISSPLCLSPSFYLSKSLPPLQTLSMMID